MSITTCVTTPSPGEVTDRLTAREKTLPLAKNMGAAIRTTTTPGAVNVPGGASTSSESVGLSSAASTSMAGFAARLARLISARTKATRMPAIAPINRVTRKQTTPTANSNLSRCHSRASALKPSSGRMATLTIAPMAGEGTSESSEAPNSRSNRVPAARTSEGSWVREPAWSMAAVRLVEAPTVKLPCAPAAMLLRPNAVRSRFGRVR